MSKTFMVDLNNLAFVTRFSVLKTPKSTRKKDPDATLYIFYSMLDITAKYAKKFRCDNIVVACDSKNTWRKDMYPEYKAKDKEKDIYFSEVLEAADMYIEFMRNHTAANVLKVDKCEADDIIAYWCLNKSFDDEVVIFSTDKDYVQLLSDTVSIFTLSQKEFMTSQDPQYDLFLKCIRGDRSDNIPSAYPRLRETKIRDAYSDDEKLLNLLETVFDDGSKMGDQFEFNNDLIDFTMIPDHVCKRIGKVIDESECGKFSELKAMEVLAGMGLKASADVLENKTTAFKNPAVFRHK